LPRSRVVRSTWCQIADGILQQAVSTARAGGRQLDDPLAGLKIDDRDVDRLLSELVESPFLQGEEELARIAANAGLDPLEGDLLAVLCAVELDPRRQRLVAYLNDDVSQRRVTPYLADHLLGPGRGVAARLAPGARLATCGLIVGASEGPWGSSPIAVPAAVIWWLIGDRHQDPELPPGATEIPETPLGAHEVVTATGPDRLRRIDAALVALRPTAAVVTPMPESEDCWRALVRRATLMGAGVVLECDDDLPPVARDVIDRTEHLCWGMVSEHELPLGSLPSRQWVSICPPPAAATVEEWEATLGPIAVGHRRHDLSAEQLHQVGRAAVAAGGDLGAGIRRLAAGQIDQLAVPVHPARTWEDLVLTPDRLSRVREVVIRYRHRAVVYGEWGFADMRSRGVVALFAGPSGTGKTLAAEIIAGELGLDLYKIDLAQLVSKYIGETEKNLSQVFDAAEASNVVLFFDEADALLGKRSEVSDAHDRYANIEVAYLLQRLERHDGLVVLATNLLKNIDAAFTRRLHVSVDFPMPQQPERRRIWNRAMPEKAPVDGLDLDFLAERFELSGGSISNVALTAAFLAAEAGTPITMEIMMASLQNEFHKLGRFVSAEEFAVPHLSTSHNSRRPRMITA